MRDVEPIESVDLRLTNGTWDFAESEKVRIAAHWQSLAAKNGRVWNGTVLICHHAELADRRFIGRFHATDYASFVAWRDWGNPGPPVYNCFGSAVVRSRDGALLYGRMAAHTLNPGKVYPPGGSLEPGDVDRDSRVDVLGSIVRELKEETGLDADEARKGELLAVDDGPRISIAQVFDFEYDAAGLAARVNDYLASQQDDELDGIEIIASSGQIDARMPGYAAKIARHVLGG